MLTRAKEREGLSHNSSQVERHKFSSLRTLMAQHFSREGKSVVLLIFDWWSLFIQQMKLLFCWVDFLFSPVMAVITAARLEVLGHDYSLVTEKRSNYRSTVRTTGWLPREWGWQSWTHCSWLLNYPKLTLPLWSPPTRLSIDNFLSLEVKDVISLRLRKG